MQRLVLLTLIGFFAQLVDGSLGMGYGVSSASLLLAAGIAPVTASATVHAAEVVTTFASGMAHWRFRNINIRVTVALAVPGAVGAFLGALFLAAAPGEVVKPFISGFLFLLGLSILVRFVRRQAPGNLAFGQLTRRRHLMPLGLVAGFFDASGGGGWGPITAPTLMVWSQAKPRKVVGSVDTSEAAVALAATAGFLLALGWETVNITWIAALVIGGIIAAPIAAWLVRRIPSRLLGGLVGAMILLTNARTLLGALGVSWIVWVLVYLAIVALCLLVLAQILFRHYARSVTQTGAD